MLERFAMQDSKPVTTPLAAHFRLSVDSSLQLEDEEKLMSKVPYASTVGSHMYAS